MSKECDNQVYVQCVGRIFREYIGSAYTTGVQANLSYTSGKQTRKHHSKINQVGINVECRTHARVEPITDSSPLPCEIRDECGSRLLRGSCSVECPRNSAIIKSMYSVSIVFLEGRYIGSLYATGTTHLSYRYGQSIPHISGKPNEQASFTAKPTKWVSTPHACAHGRTANHRSISVTCLSACANSFSHSFHHLGFSFRRT